MPIVPFQREMCSQAGELLALRHRQDRARFPLLPSSFENPVVAHDAIEAYWNKPERQGVAMIEEGCLLGYLLGEMVLDQQWGRSAWMHPHGCAIAPDQNMEVLCELYAALGSMWVQRGIFTHFALMPAGDQAFLNGWHSLSFGIEQTHALLDMTRFDMPKPVLEQGVTIRRATPEDADTLRGLADILWLHLTQAPVWAVSLPENEEKRREGYAKLLTEENTRVWLAFVEGKPAGLQTFSPEPMSAEDLITPENCLYFGVAAMREEYRSRGIAKALFYHGMQEGLAQGYKVAETDWRTTNLLANRAWQTVGFKAVLSRLVRRIDTRIAWGNGGWQE